MVKDNTGQAETDPYDFEANEAMEEMRGYLGVNAKTALCKTYGAVQEVLDAKQLNGIFASLEREPSPCLDRVPEDRYL